MVQRSKRAVKHICGNLRACWAGAKVYTTLLVPHPISVLVGTGKITMGSVGAGKGLWEDVLEAGEGRMGRGPRFRRGMGLVVVVHAAS